MLSVQIYAAVNTNVKNSHTNIPGLALHLSIRLTVGLDEIQGDNYMSEIINQRD